MKSRYRWNPFEKQDDRCIVEIWDIYGNDTSRMKFTVSQDLAMEQNMRVVVEGGMNGTVKGGRGGSIHGSEVVNGVHLIVWPLKADEEESKGNEIKEQECRNREHGE